MPRTIFFDLDGTLINSQNRLYQLFTDLTKKSLLTSDEYWKLKRSLLSHEWILKKIYSYTELEIEIFKTRWLSLIEDNAYLQYDTLFDYTISTLEKVKQHNLYIITARQHEQKAIDQIKKFNIHNYLKDILVTRPGELKENTIRRKNIPICKNDIFIGDTGLDIQAGKALDIFTIGVLSGFRNFESLKNYTPNYIFNNISEISTVIQ